MRIRNATTADAGTLSRVAMAAKAHWGYPDAWLAQWKNELTISPDFIRAHPTFVAVEDEQSLGFAAIELAGHVASLAHFWVHPSAMGRGIGRALFSHCEAVARASGATEVEIESDPHAEGFYLHLGAQRIGKKSADIGGVSRFLPVLRKPLD